MKTVWLMLAFWIAPGAGHYPNPSTAPAKAYESRDACIAAIPSTINKDVPRGEYAVACIEGVVPPKD